MTRRTSPDAEAAFLLMLAVCSIRAWKAQGDGLIVKYFARTNTAP
jgi:hypothetical protein